jgi:hypothetical protein
MSGGHFQYKQYEFGQIADEIEQIILDNDSEEVNEYGDTIATCCPGTMVTESIPFSELTTNKDKVIQRFLLLRLTEPDSFECAPQLSHLVY